MKKAFLVSGLIMFLMSSCKKDYTCVCSTSFLGTTVSVTTEAKSSKKSAEEWCNSFEAPSTTVDGAPTTNLPLNCEIK